MTAISIILLLVLLQTKHLLIDWIWQPPYEWQNKGTLFHPGGLIHAGKNALGTALCFWIFDFNLSALMMIFAIDFTIHYVVDYCKMNINKIFGWGPTTHPQFWWLTGFDQYLHQMTYLFLVLFVI